jgi:hypothetical protein
VLECLEQSHLWSRSLISLEVLSESKKNLKTGVKKAQEIKIEDEKTGENLSEHDVKEEVKDVGDLWMNWAGMVVILNPSGSIS